jgi:exopolysaccharide biosynthesis protein
MLKHILLLALFLGGCARHSIQVQKFEATTPDGPARGYVAFIDLADPRIEVVVDGPISPKPDDPKVEAILEPTDAWAHREHTTLAINANFFSVIHSDDGKHQYIKGAQADILGLSLSRGQMVSPPREFNGEPDPAIIFSSDRRAKVGHITKEQAVAARDGVAGIGRSDSDKTEGALLVEQGINRGTGARVAPTKRHPRTAVGVDATGRHLVVLVVDGRQPNWSVGATLPELADWLIQRGVRDAINLDGGGSTAFIYDPADGPEVTNKPSDGNFRPTANHLGFRIKP